MNYPTRYAKCPECGGQAGRHNAYCSKNKNHPTPERKSPPQKNKSNPIKREDDGRRRK